MSSIFFCKAVALFSCLHYLASAGFVPYQEPVHFARSSTQSSTSTLTSSSTTSTTSFQSTVINKSSYLIRSFPLSRDGVRCEYRSYGQGRTSSITSQNLSRVSSTGTAPMLTDLRPYDCHVQCAPATSLTPSQPDCQKILNTIRTKQGSITLQPRTWISVSYNTCALVFENTNSHDLAVMYDWHRLAQQASRLQAQCPTSLSTPGYPSNYASEKRGACFFTSCDLEKSQSGGATTTYNGSPQPPYLNSDNSGIMVTFQNSGRI